jgi:hypothetical protein
MYSFAQRNDTLVVDEPYYACYLAKTGIDHPGKAEVLKAQSADEEVVTRDVFKRREKTVLFIKNMAHHIAVLKGDLLSRCVNIFLIRNPKHIIASYAQVIESPTLQDIGIAHEYELFSKAKNPIVIDSGLLLENPESCLRQLTERAGIEFQEQMLHWAAGPKPYDGVWAPYWYANVHKSTGFEKQSTSDRKLPDQFHALCEEATVYYHKLLEHAITP